MSDTTVSKFVWHEIMATDVDASRAFFTDLFGWTVEEKSMGPMGTYTRFLSAGVPVGGMMALDAGPEVPSHWIGYVLVDDVDAACERAGQHGGSVCVPGMDIPEVGRFAVVTDPGGAVISPFSTTCRRPEGGEAGGGESGGDPEPGMFCWNELLTPDPDAARAYYGELFGWTGTTVDMGEMGPYTMLAHGETQVAAMMKMPEAAGERAHWLFYVTVDDVDASAARISALGGKILVEPRDIPNIGRFSVASDPTGAMFAVWCR